MYSPASSYYDEGGGMPCADNYFVTYFDPVQCMNVPIAPQALEERRIAIWLSWFIGTWSDNYGNLVHVEGNVSKCKHLYYSVVNVTKRKVVDSGMIYFDLYTYKIHLDHKFELDTDFSDDLTVRWRPVNPSSATCPLWTHIERLDRCAKWHVLNDMEVSRNSNVERYLMNKTKELKEAFPSASSSSPSAVLEHAAASSDATAHSSPEVSSENNVNESASARPTVAPAEAEPPATELTKVPPVSSAVADWRNAPSTKPEKPVAEEPPAAVWLARREYASSLGFEASAAIEGSADLPAPLARLIDTCLSNPPLPPGWEESRYEDGVDGDGVVYYFDPIANQSTWAHPIDAAAKLAMKWVRQAEAKREADAAEELTGVLLENINRFAEEVASTPVEWSGPYSLPDGGLGYLHANSGRVTKHHPVSLAVYKAQMASWLFCVYFGIPAPPRELMGEVYQKIFQTLKPAESLELQPGQDTKATQEASSDIDANSTAVSSGPSPTISVPACPPSEQLPPKEGRTDALEFTFAAEASEEAQPVHDA
ncbi:hypothetical protein FOL47_009299 [Perkinsus chesapeaki]|uniref:WW domain-containing protein n=1 Tax=Perkinsus chesapeaki TaxID=330153 RepID=A0A7J6MT51_PERCH|nr:hypothetical protein FOL47_009299 [Perkinsus chesapeaki]